MRTSEAVGPSRRQLLAGAVATAAAVGVAAPTVVGSPAPASRHRVFAHGVASGDPLPDAVVLWTRVTPTSDATPGSGRGGPAAVTWEVALDREFRDVVRTGSVTVDTTSDHTVKVDVTGLTPATEHHYRFRCGGEVSPVGRTRTAAAPGTSPERLRLGVVSCANWQAGFFAAYRHLAEAGDLDAVVHLGDYLYEYPNGTYGHGVDWTDVRPHDPPHETVTLADYRRRHAQYKTDPDLQLLHARAPFVVTWDDHEVADGWHPGGAFEHQEQTEGPFADRRAAALRAYDEWMPVRLAGTAATGDGTRIQRLLSFGDLADLAMLDLRGYRDARVEPTDPALGRPDRTLAGAEQHRWLVEHLTTSPAQWKLVGNPVMIAPMLMPPRPRVEQLAVEQVTAPATWGPARPNTDTWDGYPAERARLLGALEAAGVRDVVFLSGDVHTAWANEVHAPSGRLVAAELVCASVTSNNVDDFMGSTPRSVSLAIEQSVAELNDHVRYVNSTTTASACSTSRRHAPRCNGGPSVTAAIRAPTRTAWRSARSGRVRRASSRRERLSVGPGARPAPTGAPRPPAPVKRPRPAGVTHVKSTTENLSPTRVKLTIEVPFDEFKPSLDKAYKTIGSQIQVPGFRKGKVPAAIVDQRIGRGAVLDEAINSALPGWYSAAVAETKVQPLGQPEIDLTKFVDGEDIEVTAEVDVRPEIALPDLSTITVTVPDAAVSDADVDEQLEALRQRFATFTVVERAAAEGDALTIDLSAAHQDGTLIDEAQAEGLPYTVGAGTMLEGLDEAVTGLSAGESATFSTTLLGGELKDTEVDVTVTVTEVKQTELPELDAEFVQTASEFDTLEELRADLTEKVTRGKRLEQAAQARDLVLEDVLAAVEAPLPDALVEAEIAARRQQIEEQLAYAGVTFETYLDDEEKTADEFEAELERSVRDGITSQFVLDQIVATEELGLDDAELSQHIFRRAQQSGQDPSHYIQHIMEHNHVPEMVSEVLRGKALASLVEGATVVDESGNSVELKRLRADGSIAEETTGSEAAEDAAAEGDATEE